MDQVTITDGKHRAHLCGAKTGASHTGNRYVNFQWQLADGTGRRIYSTSYLNRKDGSRNESGIALLRKWATGWDGNDPAWFVDNLDALRGIEAALDAGFDKIKINTVLIGGFNDDEIASAVAGIRAVSALPGLFIEGMFTHFAMSDEDYAGQMTADPSSRTWTQLSRYRAVLAGLEAAGCRPPVCHVCNSAAAVRFPGLSDFAPACLDMVRLGINLYGYGVPAPEEGFPALKPVMTLKTRVTHLHTLQPGEQVGYGGTYSAGTPRTIATLPIGYADGFIRALKGCSVVIHTAEGDVTAPLAGRICMDQCMADGTGLPVSVGDTVTLFGDDPAQLEALAARAGTITYELLCLLTARVPRFTV